MLKYEFMNPIDCRLLLRTHFTLELKHKNRRKPFSNMWAMQLIATNSS